MCVLCAHHGPSVQTCSATFKAGISASQNNALGYVKATDIIAQLEQQRDAIDHALDALRSMSIPGPKRPGRLKKTATAATKKRQLSPEERARIIAALKKRWAATKKAAKAKRQRSSGLGTVTLLRRGSGADAYS